MKGMCQASTAVPIEGIIENTPAGQIAMFEIVSIPGTVEDWYLGEHVYVHKGRLYDFIADERVPTDVKAEDLRFIKYINRG